MKYEYRMVRRVQKRSGTGEARLHDTFYEIREVYYNDEGVPYNVNAEAIAPAGNTMDELRRDLAMMLRATYEPVFKVTETGKRRAGGPA